MNPNQDQQSLCQETQKVDSKNINKYSSHRKARKCFHLTPKIIKCFGKKICQFIESNSATPYLDNLTQKENIELKDFNDYFIKAHEFFEENGNFYSLLATQMTDDHQMKSYKRITKQISQIFIKYHSLEWILTETGANKEIFLKCRLKMLNAVRFS